ncbi:MAG TPA: PPOX class F420-dependent oxidoreductase [Ilumatobacteraceae bacterium]|jgi:PPOX class probable F420-dependent enzyme|nr:PPOX class F420-dependent oxidoreductase [Ilumatobacteraceae bacterium]
MAATMTDDEVRAFLSAGTRTGKLAWTAASGQPHVAPIWFAVDDAAPALEVVFNTGADSAKGRALQRDPRVSLLVDDERPPFAFVKLTGRVEIGTDLDEMRTWATRIGGRYMGADRAEEFGRRNGVPGELLVRLRPARVIAQRGVAD